MPKKERQTLALQNVVRMTGNPMFLRQNLATAEGDDFEVEVAANINGDSILLTYKRAGRDGWVTWVLPARSLVAAVLAHEVALEDSAAATQN